MGCKFVQLLCVEVVQLLAFLVLKNNVIVGASAAVVSGCSLPPSIPFYFLFLELQRHHALNAKLAAAAPKGQNSEVTQLQPTLRLLRTVSTAADNVSYLL